MFYVRQALCNKVTELIGAVDTAELEAVAVEASATRDRPLEAGEESKTPVVLVEDTNKEDE